MPIARITRADSNTDTDGIEDGVTHADLRIGDLICIRMDEEVPADVVVLYTSRGDGTVSIDTSNLDGEAALKSKRAVGPMHKV